MATFPFTANFLRNARGFIIADSATVTWAFDKNTNTLTATGSGGGGGITSVGFADTSSTAIYTVTNSPLVANGTIDITLNTQTANTVLSGPTTGAAAQPTFRALVAADLPAGTTPVGANPTGTVGPTATNGSAATFLRSDGAPAINLTATYTWTGVHTFSHTGVAIEVKGDTALFDVQNTAGADVIQIGTVKAVLGSGTNVTDAALLSIAAMSFFTNSSATLQMQLTTSGLTVGAAPTGGGKGTGTINVSGGYYVNGTALAASPLTTKGDLYGHSTVDARIPVGANGTQLTADSSAALGVSWQSAGSPGVPGTIADLTLWWASDDILGAAAAFITRLKERTPWITGIAAANSSGKVAIDSTQLNSLNILKWPAAAVSGTYTLPASFLLATTGGTTGGTGGATFFVVARSSTATGSQAIIGGGANGLSLYLTNAGAKTVSLVKTGAAIIGSSSTVWTNATGFQANATYNATTGAYAFRQGQAGAGSGTGATGAGTGLTNTFGADGGTNLLNVGSLAELIVYDRLLSAGEILSVEAYLNAKWGV